MTALIGIDVGTRGVCSMAVHSRVETLGEAQAGLVSDYRSGTTHEQAPEDWWSAVARVLSRMAAPEIAGIAVTSTSGTPAKAAWVKRHEPRVWERACYILHPADWLAGKLTGEFGVSDYSDVLKLGYDAEIRSWSEAVRVAGMPAVRLPRVVGPGMRIGSVSRRGASGTGPAAGTPVLAHSIYGHRHPAELWAPSAARNIGPGILPTVGATGGEKDVRAANCLPGPAVGYFLNAPGERFPFLIPQASTCMDGVAGTAGERHAARLQPLASVERWGYGLMEECGIGIGQTVFSTGGAARSAVYSTLRASALNRCVVLSGNPRSAFGAAVPAAAEACFSNNTGSAIRAITSVGATFQPVPELAARNEEIYGRFREACSRRGYGS